MAFAIAGLYRVIDLPYAGAIWCYDTTDAAAVVDTTGYFSGLAVQQLRLGDLIIRRTFDALSPPTSVTTMGFHIVNSNDGTTVDTTDTLALTVTDTD